MAGWQAGRTARMVTNSVSCSQTVRFPHVRAEDLNLTFCCNRWCGSQPKGYTSRRQYRKDLTTCAEAESSGLGYFEVSSLRAYPIHNDDVAEIAESGAEASWCKDAAVLCLSLPEFARKLARIGSKDYLQLVWKKDKKGYNSKVELATLATGLDHPSK
ncbi:unnamed protein product [Fusarium graminearum]|nr:unnamed protein product [Fusarium graminearum]CAG1963194.1 unnamed protein product [Fusarium graminearum]